MPKNIVVCCDGTSNHFSRNRTNVAKLCLTLLQESGKQEVFYHPGLGTMEPPGALTSLAIKLTKFLGLAIGYGLQNDIRDAYVFLMNHYAPGDRVFLFGFSRGAYTVRALTGLLRMYGLLRPGNEPLVPYAIRMMYGINNLPGRSGKRQVSARISRAAEDIWGLAKEFKRTVAVACKPAFVGLWDTVNSVGLISQTFHVPYTSSNPDIAVARHALAIDEHRGFFRPAQWFPKPLPSPEHGPKDLLQVWFAGCHSDVGGGFPEEESGLSKCALAWMIGEAAEQGLLFVPERLREMLGQGATAYIKPDPNAALHDSLTGFWWFLEFVPKKRFDPQSKTWHYRVNLFARRRIPDGAAVHEAVFARRGYREQCPNFPKDPKIVRTKTIPGLESPGPQQETEP
jgi:uncharacterized protein (DUF2235 family)